MGINRYQNGSWTEIDDLKYRREGEWQSAELSRYGPEGWELLWPCHFTYTKQYSLSSFVVFKGKSTQTQISKDYLVIGCSDTPSTAYMHETLMFFPMDELAADLSGSSILKASLQLRRLPKQAADGNNTASINVGYSLSGVDPTATDNTWSRKYTLLTDKPVKFTRGQTQDIPISTAAVTALLNGRADCLCLPTESAFTYTTSGYAFFDPESTVLTVTYYL